MTKVQYLRSDVNKEMNLPFSVAVKVGNMLYLSGQVGILPGGSELALGGIQGETKQAMENIKMVLEKEGSSMKQVVKCTVFMADMAEWEAMNRVYVTFFDADRMPARSAVGVSGLALGARVEIECLATLD